MHPTFEKQIQEKETSINREPLQLKRAVSAYARSAIERRARERFFTDLYEVHYGRTIAGDRPFLNIGPGSFRHPYWQTADKIYGNDGTRWTDMRRGITQSPPDHNWDMYARQPLPVPSASCHVVYCSHVIEHGFNDDVVFLLEEARRILRPNGVLRIVCPDADLIARALACDDWSYLMHYLVVKTLRRKADLRGIQELFDRGFFHSLALEWVSLVTNKENAFYLTEDKCRHFFLAHASVFDAFDEASRLSSRELNSRIGGHVNWFNFDKVADMLGAAGFKHVVRSGYLQSRVPVLRDANHFDRTDPEMSLYVDAW